MSSLFGLSGASGLTTSAFARDSDKRRRDHEASTGPRRSFAHFGVPSDTVRGGVSCRTSIVDPLMNGDMDEDISTIDFEPIEGFAGPSTSLANVQRHASSRYTDLTTTTTTTTTEGPNRIFCPMARRPLLPSGYQHKSLDDSVRVSRTFGLLPRTETTNRLDDCSNSSGAKTDLGLSKLGHRMFGLQRSSNYSVTEETSKFSQSITSTNYQSMRLSNDPMRLTTKSRVVGPGSKLISLRDSMSHQGRKGGRFNFETVKDDEGFVKPTMSSIIRPRKGTGSSNLFGRSGPVQNMTMASSRLFNTNCDMHMEDSHQGFSATHIPSRDVDSFSDSRLLSDLRHNQADNISLGRSVMSAVSVKAAMIRTIENIHHQILTTYPKMSVDNVRSHMDNLKQMVHNIDDITYTTLQDVDAVSGISYSSRNTCATTTDTSVSLKRGKDILQTLMLSKESRGLGNNLINGHGSNNNQKLKLSRIEEERKSTAVRDISDIESEDSALVFKKPKPFSKSRKKKSPPRLKIKTPKPPAKKSPKSKESGKPIRLKQWYPVAVGDDLLFRGTDDTGVAMETEPVKKRINNRKVVLLNGSECNLIGNPSDLVSGLPKEVVKQLRDGLTAYWRVLQQKLLKCKRTSRDKSSGGGGSSSSSGSKKKSRKSGGKGSADKSTGKVGRVRRVEEADAYETTPKTRRKPVAAAAAASGSTKGGSSSSRKKRESIGGARRADTPVTIKKGSAKRPRVGRPSLLLKTTPKLKRARVQGRGRGRPTGAKRKSQGGEPGPKSAGTPGYKTPKGKTGSKTANESGSGRSTVRTRSGRVVKNALETPRTLTARNEVTSSGVGSSKRTGSSGRRPNPSKTAVRKTPKPTGSGSRSKAETVAVHSTTHDDTHVGRGQPRQASKRKREVNGDVTSAQAKKAKSESAVEKVESQTRVGTKKSYGKGKGAASKAVKENKGQAKATKSKSKKTTSNRSVMESTRDVTGGPVDFEENFDLGDLEVPEMMDVSGNPKLTRSQLRIVSMETPPLKYFNNNLKLLKTSTPVASPDWCISERSQSEVKQFQMRRAAAHKKKVTTVEETRQRVTTTKVTGKTREIKKVMEWVTERGVRTPDAGGCQLMRMMLPSRKYAIDEDEDDDDGSEE